MCVGIYTYVWVCVCVCVCEWEIDPPTTFRITLLEDGGCGGDFGRTDSRDPILLHSAHPSSSLESLSDTPGRVRYPLYAPIVFILPQHLSHGKAVRQGCILSPCLFNLYAEYIIRNAGLEKHKLESRLPGEISITSDMQMTPPLWQKVKST